MPRNFDRVAGIYRTLEHLAFGHSLERARGAHLEAVTSSANVLVVGEGDGRWLAQFLASNAVARVRCVDASAAMLGRARDRLSAGARDRVTFEHADLRAADFGDGRYDLVVTMFVLDCFTPADAAAIVDRLARSLQPGGRWLFVDFVLPPRGWRRRRAALWIGLLYTFFRWQAGLNARALPPSERLIAAAGLEVKDQRDFDRGMIRSVLFEKRAVSSAVVT